MDNKELLLSMITDINSDASYFSDVISSDKNI